MEQFKKDAPPMDLLFPIFSLHSCNLHLRGITSRDGFERESSFHPHMHSQSSSSFTLLDLTMLTLPSIKHHTFTGLYVLSSKNILW